MEKQSTVQEGPFVGVRWDFDAFEGEYKAHRSKKFSDSAQAIQFANTWPEEAHTCVGGAVYKDGKLVYWTPTAAGAPNEYHSSAR